jgi:hypothetical protein
MKIRPCERSGSKKQNPAWPDAMAGFAISGKTD